MSRRCATYEEIGLIGPIQRDPSSRYRRYGDEDLDTLQALACLRAMGVGIEDIRTCQANRGRGHERSPGASSETCVPKPTGGYLPVWSGERSGTGGSQVPDRRADWGRGGSADGCLDMSG